MQVVTPRGLAHYVYVFSPQKAMEEGKPDQYSMMLSWEHDDPKLKTLRATIQAVAERKFGAKAAAMLKSGQLKNPLREADETTKGVEPGRLFLTARSTEQPGVVGPDGEPVMDKLDIYSGMTARMDVWLYAFEKKGNKGVAAILNNVQKLADGTRTSGRRPASEAFADYAEEDEALM